MLLRLNSSSATITARTEPLQTTTGGFVYKPIEERVPDTQYGNALRFLLRHGEVVKDTPQGVGAITSLEVPKMVFDLQNGFPMITERNMLNFWRKPVDELFAFIRGARTNDELLQAGCDFWTTSTTAEKCATIGVPPGDLGPGSYGAAFHNFPMPGGGSFNQFAHLIDQMKRFPSVRTHFISPWIPFFIGRGGYQKAVTTPCHGWIHCRNYNGGFYLHMFQRAADMPIGVPNNIVQYAALTLVLASITGNKPRR
jgi:thymidylate synthase